jgi:uncharacterized protein YgiM (DUF1202 family)
MKKIFLVITLGLLLTACHPKTACTLTPSTTVTIYNRPSAASDVFGSLNAGESINPTVKTADGFYGFDPGVAQAGNVGVFRNRWILKTYQVATSGNCAGLPTVVGPISNLCYAMSMGDSPVRTAANTASPLVTTLHLGDYAQVLGTSSGWVQVDLNVGSPSLENTGWIEDANIGYNGTCP